MPTVKLTKTELAALDTLIETLKDKESPRARKVPLGKLVPAMLTTVVIDATKVVGAGTRLLPGDEKLLAQARTLVRKLRSRMSLADLLELRRSATSKKRRAK